MTDKELKKLSRLELLELLLNESRENERLRIELDKLKNENSVQKSAQHLNEASDKMQESLQNAAVLADTLNRLISGKIVISDIPTETQEDSSEDIIQKDNSNYISESEIISDSAVSEADISHNDTENTLPDEEVTQTDEEITRTKDESDEMQQPTEEKASAPSDEKKRQSSKNSADVHIYTRLMSYFHKNSYALAFIPEDIKIDIEKRLEEITGKKIN